MTLEEAIEISMLSFNNNWTKDDFESEDTFKAMCICDRDITNVLTQGKIYSITMAGCILAGKTLCYTIGDDGKKCHVHATRFVKIEKEFTKEHLEARDKFCDEAYAKFKESQ